MDERRVKIGRKISSCSFHFFFNYFLLFYFVFFVLFVFLYFKVCFIMHCLLRREDKRTYCRYRQIIKLEFCEKSSFPLNFHWEFFLWGALFSKTFASKVFEIYKLRGEEFLNCNESHADFALSIFLIKWEKKSDAHAFFVFSKICSFL